MILHRYINRQLLVTTVVVTFVLVMVLVSGRFIKYLADAAVGKIAADVLFQVMAFRLPEFLQMILPLSLYIAVLLVLGRMYVEHEMVVLNACGISPSRFIRIMMLPMIMASLLIAFFAFYVTPHGDAQVARIFDEQRERSVLELLTPGRFHVRGSSSGGYRATYAEALDRDDGALERVFLSEFRPDRDFGPVDRVSAVPGEMLTVWADRGRIIQHDGISYLELLQGTQYQGQPGDANFRKAAFERALVRIGREEGMTRPPAVRAWTTPELLASLDQPDAYAELQWRISLVAILPIMMIAAIPLARVNPRQGRFGKLIPAVLLYMFYMGMLLVMRGWIADTPVDERPFWYHTAWIHVLAIMLVILIYTLPGWQQRRRGGLTA